MQVHKVTGMTSLHVTIGALRLASEKKAGSGETQRRVAAALWSAELDASQERRKAADEAAPGKKEQRGT